MMFNVVLQRLILASGLLAASLSGLAFAGSENGGDRIVVAGGDLTEIMFAIGHGDRVAGVDTTSTFPEATAELPQVGYMRRISAEGVLSLAPSLVLAAHDAGPENALDQLRSAGVPVAIAPAGEDPDAVIRKIEFVGEAVGAKAEADALVQSYSAELERVRAVVADLTATPKVLFILAWRDGAPLAAGSETSADAIIRAAAGQNVAEGFTGYKPLSQEALIALAPDVIVMMSQHAERAGGLDEILQRPEIARTPAGRNARLVDIDGVLLLGFGQRTPTAIAELAARLHEDDPAVGRF